MDINQIRNLAISGESPSVEFKTSTSELGKACQSVCAFLNAKGGFLLFGVKNNGQLVGQHVTDNTRLEIARELKKIESPANEEVNIHYESLSDGKFIIVLQVMAGKHAPYTYDGRSYVRVESSTGIMSQHLYEQLLVRRGQLNHAWEDQPVDKYSINDLDHEEIRRTIKEGVDKNRISVEVLSYEITHILEELKLLQNEKLINAAMVLYAKEVKPDYDQCMIRLARFRGVDKLGDFIDNQRVYGNVFRVISAAMEFATRHLPIASFFEPGKIQRIDQPAVPLLALREALVNSVSHRDYTNRSASIALAIYDDRLEIWNNGTLPPQLKIEDLRRTHQSYPRNEEIATIFYERGWVEGWGTGTTRMIGYCNENGTPEPEFQEYSGGFAVTFRFKEVMGGSRKVGRSEKPELNKRQEKILKILANGQSMDVNEIFNQLDDVASLRTVKADLAILKKLFLVEQVGKGRAALWKIKA